MGRERSFSIYLKVIFLITLLFSCAKKKELKEKVRSIPQKCTGCIVKVDTIRVFTTGYGKAEPVKKVDLYVRGEGKVIYFKKREGESVHKGELIFEVRDESLLDRMKALEQEMKLHEIEADMRKTRSSEYYRLKSEYESLKYDLQSLKVYAPFTGYIVDINVNEGEFVKKGDKVFSIVDISRLLIRVNIPIGEAQHIKKNNSAIVRFPQLEDLKVKGRVCGVSKISRNGRSTVEVIIENSEKKIPAGAFCKVRIVKDIYPDKLVVPKRAVLERDGKKFVFLVKNNVALWKYVKTGVEGERFVEIKEGEVSPVDTVLVEGHSFLSHNSPVKVIKLECTD